MARSTAHRLAAYQRSYRELAEGIADIGFIAAGTVTRRHTRQLQTAPNSSKQLQSSWGATPIG